MMDSMQPRPFMPTTMDDLELACEIERDAESIGLAVTLERYLAAASCLAGAPSAFPLALDAAIEVTLRALGSRS